MAIFNFLKKTANSETDIAVFKGKSNNELVAEIHETFNTEVDRLLLEAGILKPLPDTDKALLTKADRLQNLGFNNTIETKEASKQRSVLNEVEKDNGAKNELKKTIKYFSQKYPLYKFITEDSVVKICKKYNLIYGDVSRYVGDVPDKNLTDIENFKLEDTDELWIEEYMNHMGMSRSSDLRYITATEAEEKSRYDRMSMPSTVHYSYNKARMEIAAPLKDFNTEGMEIENFKLNRKIEIPDPVVLYPVLYKGKKHYLIITAWGEEASDELVVNQKFN